MSDDKETKRSEADAELEREIRKGRKFTVAEAIGRMAGPGAMKGVSPITRKQQAEVEIENWLTSRLADPSGALQTVMLRAMKESQFVLADLERPLAALRAGIQRVLGSDYLMEELVRNADIEWGRVFGARPYFEEAGSPAHPEDPYTLESVRSTLSHLLGQLAEEKK